MEATKQEVKVSETNKFKILCNEVRYKIADRKLLPESEQDKLSNEFFLALFNEASVTKGNPKDFFMAKLNVENWNNILKVLYTNYLVYVTLCSSQDVKIGEAK